MSLIVSASSSEADLKHVADCFAALRLSSLNPAKLAPRYSVEQHISAFLRGVGESDPQAAKLKYGLIGAWVSLVTVGGLLTAQQVKKGNLSAAEKKKVNKKADKVLKK